MEAATLCALMLKAKKVFAKEQTFLSFPISPLPYTPRQLDFFDQSSPAALLESTHHRKEFSILVDMIAPGEAWQPSADARLSETYRSVLAADYAVSTRTADEEAQYQAARAVLRTDDHDSDKLLAYRQARDAYMLAEQRYTAAALTAANADAEQKLAWQQTGSPALRRELAELLQTWMFEGFKEEIETAQVQVANLGARSPALTWEDLDGRYNRDIDSLSDAKDGMSVMPSGFSPTNAIADQAWRSFTLSPAEITSLLQEAPPAWLNTVLGTTTPQGTQAISFDFSSAVIVRPWFDPGLFKARFWKFSDAGRQLSDGKSPATGECPAYVAALVFARKVKVTGADPHADAAPTRPFEGFHFMQATHLTQARIVKRELEPLDNPIQPGEMPPHFLVQRRMAMPAREMLAVARTPALAAVSRPAFATEMATMAVRAPAATAVSKAAVDMRVVRQFDLLKSDRMSERTDFVLPFVIGAAPPAAPPAASPSPPPAPAVDDDTVYVLAFICKALPLCPNPDPDLQW